MNEDFIPQVVDGEKEYLMTARGVLIFVVCEFVERPFEGKKIIKAAKWIFSTISKNGYGLTQMEIFSKIKLMTTPEAIAWAKSIYGRYISQEEIMSMFKNI